jgi:hypothetical protein
LTEIRFYMDENIDPEVADQLVKSGIDVVTVRDFERLGDTDFNHLQKAMEMQRVLCTHDQDFLRMHAEGTPHYGIAFGRHYGSTIGGWVKALRKLHDARTAEEMIGQIEYLSVK